MKARALLDSNVMVAIVAEHHLHHTRSSHLATGRPGQFAVAAHSLAEAYVTLTRRGRGAQYAWSPVDALEAIENLNRNLRSITLTPSQHLDAIRSYAAVDGIGPRLYDRLVGQVALRHNIGTIITWDIAHYRSLFPQLNVIEPPAFAPA